MFKKFFKRYLARASNEQGFVQAIPYILQAVSMLGGLMGGKKKYLDPNIMKQKYGARAVAADTQELANQILNSPYGQQLMKSAATSGQGLQSEMAARAAQSGLDPSTGGESGASTFASGAASQAQSGLESGVKSDIWKSAMPIAAQQNQAAMAQEYANQETKNAQPSMWQNIGSAAGNAAALFPGKKAGDETITGASTLADQLGFPGVKPR